MAQQSAQQEKKAPKLKPDREQQGQELEKQTGAKASSSNQEALEGLKFERELAGRMDEGKDSLPKDVLIWMQTQPEWVQVWLALEKQPPNVDWELLMDDVEELREQSYELEHDPEARPDFLYLGQVGGLILYYEDQPIKLHGGPGMKFSKTGEVDSGASCRIINWEGHWLEVMVDVNGKEERHWVMSAFFTDDPARLHSEEQQTQASSQGESGSSSASGSEQAAEDEPV